MSYHDPKYRAAWRIVRLFLEEEEKRVVWKEVDPWELPPLMDNGQVKGEYDDDVTPPMSAVSVDEDPDGTREFVRNHMRMFDRVILVMERSGDKQPVKRTPTS